MSAAAASAVSVDVIESFGERGLGRFARGAHQQRADRHCPILRIHSLLVALHPGIICSGSLILHSQLT